jgi:DNA-binding HxlR family transcriptional regulator
VSDLPIDELARAARLVGDRWSMLIVAALAGGGRRYGELAKEVPGISTNVLAARLEALADAGLVVGEPYSPRPDRLRYELTAEGRALIDALMALAAWSAEHVGSSDEAAALRHAACGTPLELRWHCPACDVDVEPGDAAAPEIFHA